MEIDFVTLGDASERLNVPPPTLRNWTDQVEEFQVHFVKRNNRNERVYYDNDIEIFAHIRDLKAEFGRKTTMKDIAAMMVNPENIDRFNLRSEDDAPVQNPSNKTGELITKDDIERLMDNQRVRAVLGYLVAQSTDLLREEMIAELRHEWEEERDVLKHTMREEIKQVMSEGQKQITDQLNTFEEEQKKRDNEEKEKVSKREEESIRLLKELLEQRKQENLDREEKGKESKGIFAKLFGL